MDSKILVIIVTYNGEKRAENVTNCINNSDTKLDTIIIDNLSKDKTLEIFENKLKGFKKIIRNKKNLGFGGANNIGLEYAINNNYDYVYLLNQDAWFFKDTIRKLIDLFKGNPNIGILSPFQCWDGLKRIDRNFQVYTCGYKSNNDIFSDIYFNREKSFYEVPLVMAAHWMIPVKVIKKVGGFSPTFFHYGEDDNYSKRVKYFGYKVCIATHIDVVHDRENRIDSKNKEILSGYTYSLDILSNPFENSIKNIFKVFIINLYYSLIYKTFKPIINIFKILKEYPKIKRNKKISMESEGAFLFLNNRL